MEIVSDPVFRKIYEALQRHDQRITLTTIKKDSTLCSACTIAAENATDAIYINGFEYQKTIGVITCIPGYAYGPRQSNQYVDACRKKRTEMIARCRASNTYDTVLAIHDELLRSVRYQDDSMLSHSIVGPLLLGRGVCDGFSKTLKFILDGLSIPCFVISGTATDPQTGCNESHAWNIVKLDNSWVHIDLTFDATISQSLTVRHDYFGLSAQMISRDHQFCNAFYPPSLNASLEYYRRQKLMLSNVRQVSALVMKCLSYNENSITFRLETKDCRRDYSNEIMQQVSDTLSQHRISASIALRYNVAQSVYSVMVDKRN